MAHEKAQPTAKKIGSVITPEMVKRHLLMRFNPIRGLTPETLARQLDSFKSGHLRDLALLMDSIEERDDTLQSVAPKRKKSVSRQPWEILMMEDSPEAQRHKEALEFFYNHVRCTNAFDLNERGGFKRLIRQMMDAVGKRYAVHEIIWRQLPGGLSAEFRFVPLWFFENTTGKLRFLRNEFGQDGEELEEGGWMVTVGDGIMVACAIAYMFKRMPLQDWLNFTEKFGFPGVLGKTDAAPGSEQWENMAKAVMEFAHNFAAVCNRSEAIDLIEVKGGASLPFEPLVDRMDRAMARLWRGADLSTISKGEGLGASVQADEGDILLEDDPELATETLNEYVDPYVIAYSFGPGVTPLAYIQITPPKKQNVDQDLKIDEFLSRNGAPISVQSALERYGRPMPDANEPLLSAPSPALPQPFNPQRFANESDQEIQDRLKSAARDQLAQAIAQDLAPLAKRIERVLQIEDPEIFRDRFIQLVRELRGLERDILADPEAAKVLENTMAAALLNGLSARSLKQPRAQT